MDQTLQQVDAGEIQYRFRLIKDPKELRDDLADLLNEKVSYPLPEEVKVAVEDFITADEIDHTLTRGSGFEHGSFRIYDFYHQEHTLKEAADFLKMSMEPEVPVMHWQVQIAALRIMMRKELNYARAAL